MSSSSGGSDSSAPWLGLLKWSLQYTDGTRSSDESLAPMSDEDRQFLENVMKDGIVDEGKRMQTILSDVSVYLTSVVSEPSRDDEVPSENHMVELLEELQDIVEQIDFSRALMSLGGIPFLLGCASHRRVPRPVRRQCLAVLATMAQNNPPVQDGLLRSQVVLDHVDHSNGLSQLAQLFLEETAHAESDADGSFRASVVKAISCGVRGHAVGEETFSQKLSAVLELGLGAKALVPSNDSTTHTTFTPPPPLPPLNLRQRCLFLLQALITSDTSSYQRIKALELCVQKVIEDLLLVVEEEDNDNINDDDPSHHHRHLRQQDVKEVTLSMLLRILRQKHSVDAVLDVKNRLVHRAVTRVSELRRRATNHHSEDEFSTETQLWENLLVELSRATRDVPPIETTNAPPLMVTGRPHNDPGTDLAQ